MVLTDGTSKRSGASTDTASNQGSRFWREIYWFVLIGVAGVTLALALVPPRASKYRRMLELEASLQHRNENLAKTEQDLRAAIGSMERDPVYRMEVYRRVLGVKKQGEEYLDEGQ